MPRAALIRPLPLPPGWPRRVRSAVVQVISLTRTSLARYLADEDRLRFVAYLVRRLKTLRPGLGKVKIAQILAQAGLHLAPTAVRR